MDRDVKNPPIGTTPPVSTAPKAGVGFDESDLSIVYRHGNFASWDEMITWLKAHGTEDRELTDPKRLAMISALQQLSTSKVAFTKDPVHVIEELHARK